MTKRALCKFFARGACLKGEHCEFSHQWKAPPNNMCTFYQKGVCAYGSHCRYEHIRVSQPHSSSPLSSENVSIPVEHLSEEKEEHLSTCEKWQNRLDALRRCQEIECGVCLERVLSKPTSAERKFGILCECDHTFCISCIRNWRSSSPSSGLKANPALRSCPMCRKLSYFVIPSVIWYSSKEEKQDIIDTYKTKLKTIDCKHFEFGNGACPFRNSCFYRHANCDGSTEEVVLHHFVAEDGNMVITKNNRISNDILSYLQTR